MGGGEERERLSYSSWTDTKQFATMSNSKFSHKVTPDGTGTTLGWDIPEDLGTSLGRMEFGE